MGKRSMKPSNLCVKVALIELAPTNVARKKTKTEKEINR
jgi:hypothetical protein